jgi:hypothetical protein
MNAVQIQNQKEMLAIAPLRAPRHIFGHLLIIAHLLSL